MKTDIETTIQLIEDFLSKTGLHGLDMIQCTNEIRKLSFNCRKLELSFAGSCLQEIADLTEQNQTSKAASKFYALSNYILIFKREMELEKIRVKMKL